MASNHETQSKPLPGGSFEACVSRFEGEPDVDDPEALCGWIHENGGKEALADPNADELLTSLGVEFVSAVDTPAQSSEWLIAKNAEDPTGENHRWKTEVPVFVEKSYGDFDEAETSKDDDARKIAFAPVLVPGEADKQGDVIPDHEIEKAAHGYLANHRKVDTDHDLFDGKGTPVESWTLKRDMSFVKPDGEESRTYPKGTWIMGIKFDDETWSRLKSGELSGLSIYGGAKPIDVAAVRDALGIETTKTTSKGTDEPDTEQMTDNDDGGDTPVTKELNADTVSTMLSTFKDKVDNGLSPDATVKDFVQALIDDGDVDETQLTGLSVFLGGNGGGDSTDGGDTADGGDGGDGGDMPPTAADANDVQMSNTQKDADGGDADGTDDGSADVDAGTLPDDTPDWAKSLSSDVKKSVESVRDDVDSLRTRVDDLETEVKGENLNDRMEDDDFEKRFKSILGVDDDEDVEAVRKAFREQIDADEDEPLSKSFEGIFDDGEDETETTAKAATGRNAHSNIRMPNAEGDD